MYTHRHTYMHTQGVRQGEKERAREGKRRDEKGDEKGEEKGKEKGEERVTRRERIGTKTGAVCHAVARSSEERALRCVRVMHLVCCVGKSVCATSHLLYEFPCTVAAEYATPAVRPPKGNPKCICLPSVAKRCTEGHEKQKLQWFFFELLVKPLW